MMGSYFKCLFFCLFVLGILQLSSCSSGEIYFIDATKTFNSFNLTKELKLETETESKRFTNTMDSLELAIKMESDSKTEKYRNLIYRYQEVEKTMQNRVGDLIADSDMKIWGLLNGYFKEFGQDRNYRILLGGIGNGNVLYANELSDVTDEFIDYANKKYEGE